MALVAAILLAVFVLDEPWSWAAVAAGGTIEVGESFFWIWLSKRRQAQVGFEPLIGAKAEVVTACWPLGQVKVAGEIWRARCQAGAEVGDMVRVREIDELTLVVEH